MNLLKVDDDVGDYIEFSDIVDEKSIINCIMQPGATAGSVSRNDVDFAGSLKWNCFSIADL